MIIEPAHLGLARDCIVPPISKIFDVALALDEAVQAHKSGDTRSAPICLQKADCNVVGEWLDAIWLNGNIVKLLKQEIDDLPPIVPKPERHMPRDATAEMKRALIRRDGHHCRFCSIPLVRPEVRKELVRLYPNEVRWASARSTDQHRGLQVLWLQYDHVFVHSRGGETSLDNLVVACPACNFGRGNLMLNELGIRDPRINVRKPTWSMRLEWDGLERVLPEHRRVQQDVNSCFTPFALE